MNIIRLGLSIYNQPWLVEPSAALRMLEEWEKIRESKSNWDYKSLFIEEDDAEGKVSFKVDGVIYAPDNSYSLREFSGFEGAEIAVITIDGPLMKSDYCGSLGTESLQQLTKLADNTPSVHTIIFNIDSPGGTVNGTQAFANTIANCAKNTIAYVNGMMCSAAYWIGSSCNEVIAGSDTDIIGSIGTMISWYDNTEAMKQRGVVLREYYASKSSDKNKMMRDAQTGDGKMLISEMLDPLNNVFLSAVKNNRPDVKEAAFSGKTYTAQNAIPVGLIDSIQSIEKLFKNALKGNKPKQSFMAKENLSFQNVITAIGADQIPVVEGGFLMTEEQLNKLDASLAASALAATEAAESIKDLNAKLETATKAGTSMKEKLDIAEAKVTGLEAAAAAFFGKKNEGKQDAAQNGEQPDASDNYAHNKAADDIIG